MGPHKQERMTYEEFITEWHNSAPWINAHTSGSTGTPKQIKLLKSDMEASAKATNRFFNLCSGSVFATPLSADYIAGKMMAVRALTCQGHLLPLPVSNTLKLDTVVDLLAIVPSQVESLVENVNPLMIRNVIIGGAPLSYKRVCSLIEHRFNAYVSYGMTETCSHIALARIDEKMAVDGVARFQTMPGVSVVTDDRECLVISLPALSVGKVVTNDICQILDESHFIWKGRYDFAINSGGKKLFPEEIERMIAPFMPEPFYVVGIPDEKWGEIAVAVMEWDNSDTLKEDELLSYIKHNISDHSLIPKKIFTVMELPHASNGKIKRIKPMIE